MRLKSFAGKDVYLVFGMQHVHFLGSDALPKCSARTLMNPYLWMWARSAAEKSKSSLVSLIQMPRLQACGNMHPRMYQTISKFTWFLFDRTSTLDPELIIWIRMIMMIWPSSIYIQLWKIGIYEPKWGYNLCNRTTSKCGFSQCTMDIGMSQWTMDIMWVQKWRMSIGNIWLFSVHAIGNWFQNHTASHCGCPICRVMCI